MFESSDAMPYDDESNRQQRINFVYIYEYKFKIPTAHPPKPYALFGVLTNKYKRCHQI